MKANKFILDDIGGAFTHSTHLATSPNAKTSTVTSEDSDELDSLYAQPIEPIPSRRHDATSVKNRLKAKRMAEARLVHLSEELGKLADEIRYLNPLMAETLDEAWEATEDAIEMLSDESGGW